MSENNKTFIEVKSEAEPYMVFRPKGYFEYQLSISSKGILIVGGKVLLVGNPRGELELPGGRLEKGESPEACARRELAEEVGLKVDGAEIVHAWVYEIFPDRHVFVVAYGVTTSAQSQEELSLVVEDEVGFARWVDLEDLDSCPMPVQYSVAIRLWAEKIKYG